MNITFKTIRDWCLSILIAVSYTTAQSQTHRYHIQSIAPPPPYDGNGSVAIQSVNDYGQAVGRIGFTNRNPIALLWQNGQSFALDSGFSGGEALDINNHGLVVGRANGYHPALWDTNHVLTYLPVIRSYGIAYAINDSDVVVGMDGQGGLNTLPLKWINGQVVSLCGTVPCTGQAVDINNAGDIIGWVSWYINQDLYGGYWIFQPLENFNDDDNPPTPDDFIWMTVTAINDPQRVTGYQGTLPFQNYLDTYATYWENGNVTTLDNSPIYRRSYAQGINNNGDMVGHKSGKATLWTSNGREIDLNRAIPPNTGWNLQYATDVNNLGQIVGYGGFNNKTRGFLLTPMRPGDVDGNDCVDDADLLALLFTFGSTGPNLPADLNVDGLVDDQDLLEVLFNFGSGC